MISVVIPTLNSEASLPRVLSSLVSAAVRGTVREVVIADGGSTDATAEIVEAAGARFVRSPRGRGSQLAAGAKAAKGTWLLFLHADTVLQPGWENEVEKLFEQIANGRFRGPEVAAAFHFALDDFSGAARFVEFAVALRCALFKLPYGDQGLLVNRRLYEKTGGYREIPLMEDVDLVRRIGRRRLVMLRGRAVTSPERYVRDGFARRIARNALCLALYYMRVPPRVIARIYS
ncbi:glycosyltransferase [Parvibaculum sedimenti]|uniref:Glycosyltransferase n=2 Tax=Parvibaculum sedimenti TaxID=2608632 RepID=A0A6N6VKK8_9HYPH|nr:TIGR04283 family arsenosugar biosynthesis glycosyltransferase [Parvibaculum sedimenti]KAB7739895.1 glycosyltransferase [Parvibaculum sedimenti]